MAKIKHWEELADRVITGVETPRTWMLSLELDNRDVATFKSRDSAPCLGVDLYPETYTEDRLIADFYELSELKEILVGKRIASLLVPIVAPGLRDLGAIKFVLGREHEPGWVIVYLASEDPYEPVVLVVDD